MDYKTKRVLGTFVTTAIILLVWALITGTAHAQTRASIFTTPQLLAGIPQAQRLCVHDGPTSEGCAAVGAIANEVISRGALAAASTPTIDKLRVIVAVNENCLQAHACAFDRILLANSLATALVANHITPEQFLRAMETNQGELYGMAPIYALVLNDVYMNVQRAKANGI